MNIKKFSDAMSEIDTKYVDEALNYRKKAGRSVWIKGGIIAACVILAIFAAIEMIPQKNGALPMLTIPDTAGDGMGFESWSGYDITEWDNGNPWSESMEFSTLPVYKNGSYSEVGMPKGLTQDEMTERAKKAAAALGLEAYEMKTEQKQLMAGPDGCLTEVSAEGDGTEVVVSADGTVEVRFEGGVALPEKYSFTSGNTSEEQAEQALEYLSQKYAALTGFSKPEKVLSGSFFEVWDDEGGNETDSAGTEYRIQYILYDAAGSDLENILNYTYHCAEFYPDENGKLFLIRIYDGLCCAEKIDDYPVISEDEAYELLLKGNYLTSVPYEVTDSSMVCKTELVYRNSRTDETLLPYYRFYVRLPETQKEDGLTEFGAYYVPAVSGEYIKNMPLWDGSMN